MRILVTGADGFVGRWAVQALAARHPHAILVAAIRGTATVAGAHAHERLELTDRVATEALIARCQPDGILHLAGVAAVHDAEEDPRHAMNVNLHGTMHLARATLEKVPAARFVHVGSADVYGATLQTSRLPLDEAAALAPLNAYALSKAAGDLAIGMMANRGLRAVRMRPFNHVGPGQDDRFVVSAFARQIAEIEVGRRSAVMKVGSLTARREFIDVRDVADAYARAFDLDEAHWNGTVINLAGGHLTQIGALLDMLRAHSRAAFAIEQDPALVRPDEPGYAGGDLTQAATLLGWHPAIMLDRTLEETLDYWRARIG